jgi:hypothetical protein
MSATPTAQCPASPFTIKLVQFQHSHFTNAGPTPGLQGAIQVHLIGRGVALTTAFLLHAEAVVKAVYTAFLILGSLFIHSLKQSLAQRRLESKTAFEESWKSMGAAVSAKIPPQAPLLLTALPAPSVQTKIPPFILSTELPPLPTKVIEIKEQATQTIACTTPSKLTPNQHQAPFDFIPLNIEPPSAPSIAPSETYDKLSDLSSIKGHLSPAPSIAPSQAYDKLSDLSSTKDHPHPAPSLVHSASFDHLSQDCSESVSLDEIETKDQATKTENSKPSLEEWSTVPQLEIKNNFIDSVGICAHKKSPTQQWLAEPVEGLSYKLYFFALSESLDNPNISEDIQEYFEIMLTESLKKRPAKDLSDKSIIKAINETWSALAGLTPPNTNFSLTTAFTIEKNLWIFTIGQSGAIATLSTKDQSQILYNQGTPTTSNLPKIINVPLTTLSGATLFLGTSSFYSQDNIAIIQKLLYEKKGLDTSETAQSLCKALKQKTNTAAAMVIQFKDWEAVSSDSDFEKI